MSSIPTSDVLREANPDDLRELFNRNPEQYTQGDIDFLISYYRRLREDMVTASTVRHTRARKDNFSITPDQEASINFDDL